MKKFLILVIAALFALSGCAAVLDALGRLETQELVVQEQSKPNDANMLYINMPTLDNLDYSDMDFFEDGYEVVDFVDNPDGDTATFVIGGAYLSTRFLSIDTPEVYPPTGGSQPWAVEAKMFAEDMLKNADQIILERDNKSDAFDKYDRVLAWVWVDGKLLNYMLAANGYAYVKYLYDDYRYNDELIDVEQAAKSAQRGIWSDDEPYYDGYVDIDSDTTISNARQQPVGTNVKIKGIITSCIGDNAFIEDETGGIYIYTNKHSYYTLTTGNEITIEGELINYNGFLEIANFSENDIKVISSGNSTSPITITLSNVGESHESKYVYIKGVEVTFVEYTKGQKGYTIFISKDAQQGEIRVDKYLEDYINPEDIIVGSIINVTGNVAQHHDTYQIMISGKASISYE